MAAFVLTGERRHLEAVGRCSGLAGEEAKGKLWETGPERGEGPMAGTGTPQSSCGHCHRRNEANSGLPGLGKGEAALRFEP